MVHSLIFYFTLSYINKDSAAGSKTNLRMWNGIGTFEEYFK